MRTTLDTMPRSVDDYPQVQQHAKQLRELQDKLGAAQAHLADLLAEQKRLHVAKHETDVAIALGQPFTPDPDRIPRLRQLDAEVGPARAEESALGDAVERLKVIAANGREQAQREINAQITVAAQAIVTEMTPLVEQVATLNQQLLALAAQMPYGVIPVPPPHFLHLWLEQATALRGR